MSSASPRMSRYTRQTDLEMERSTPRVGLSDYTSQRLAELRARRAAQEDDYKPTSLSPRRTGGSTSQVTDSSKSTSLTNTSSTTASATSRRTQLDNDYKSSLSTRRDLNKDYSTSSSSSGGSSLSNGSSVTAPVISRSSSYKSSGLDKHTDSTELDTTGVNKTTVSSSGPKLTSPNSSSNTGSNNIGGQSVTTKSTANDTSSTISLSSKPQSLTLSGLSTVTNSTTDSSTTQSSSSHTSTYNDITSTTTTKPSTLTSISSDTGTSTISSVKSDASTTNSGTGSSLNEQLENYKARRLQVNKDLTPNYNTSSDTAMSSAVATRSGLASDLTRQCKEYKADYSACGDFSPTYGGSTTKTTDMDDEDSVGFSSLPEQVHRKALKRGFDFTLMVVGESGMGKSTLIQSLFLNTELYNDREVLDVQDRIGKTVSIEKKYMEIEERGVKLRLTIVDTPGFNDSLCGEDSWKPVETYIDQQFEQYFKDESGLNRKNIKDNRVHCCLYFISPLGHGLKPLDVHFMKRLHYKVNIVPVIAKADTLTHAEIRKLKDKILEQIENNDIHIYEFPDCDSDEDEEFQKQDMELKASIPFAVIGSNTIVEVAGKKIRGRLYPWGIVEVDNPEHCDFTKLRQMLISTHMQDLKDVTRDCHYETYRAKHISEQMTKQAQRERKPEGVDKNSNLKPLLRPERSSKLKRDSSPNFEAIMATDQLLEQKDAQIKKMQEMLVHMQKQLQSGSPSKSPKVNGLGNL